MHIIKLLIKKLAGCGGYLTEFERMCFYLHADISVAGLQCECTLCGHKMSPEGFR